MKTLKTLALLSILFSAHLKMNAFGPLTTYTFVNPCFPFPIISAIPNTYGCYSFSATNAGASDPNGYYTWNFGDGTTAVGNFVYHCYNPTANPGPGPGPVSSFIVTLGYNSTLLCGPGATQNTATVTLNPPATGQCISGTPSVFLAGLTATVWAGSAIPEIMFRYNFGDGSGTLPYPNVHRYAACGNYVITVKNWDMNIPSDTCYAYQAVNIACATGSLTGIEKRAAGKIEAALFPNPASQIVNIRSIKAINGIKVVDLMGREMVSHENLQDTEIVLKITELPEGLYFVKCIFEGGSTATIKFNKE